MSPHRFWIFLLFPLWTFPLHAQEEPDSSVQEAPDPELPFSADEGDATTPVVTPVSAFPKKKPYDQAREVLEKAVAIWKSGDAELASETALEAYDDLLDVRIPRKQKQARRKLLAERRQAAGVYIDSSIAYIKSYVEKNGNTATAKAEGRDRLGDLRTVSREYPELNTRVSKARSTFE